MNWMKRYLVFGFVILRYKILIVVSQRLNEIVFSKEGCESERQLGSLLSSARQLITINFGDDTLNNIARFVILVIYISGFLTAAYALIKITKIKDDLRPYSQYGDAEIYPSGGGENYNSAGGGEVYNDKHKGGGSGGGGNYDVDSQIGKGAREHEIGGFQNHGAPQKTKFGGGGGGGGYKNRERQNGKGGQNNIGSHRTKFGGGREGGGYKNGNPFLKRARENVKGGNDNHGDQKNKFGGRVSLEKGQTATGENENGGYNRAGHINKFRKHQRRRLQRPKYEWEGGYTGYNSVQYRLGYLSDHAMKQLNDAEEKYMDFVPTVYKTEEREDSTARKDLIAWGKKSPTTVVPPFGAVVETAENITDGTDLEALPTRAYHFMIRKLFPS